jgi:small-conductance mechanosensitive channel/CRP-like cAMP-binding protein
VTDAPLPFRVTRRLAPPLIAIAVAEGLVWAGRALGVDLQPGSGRDYGAFLLGLAVLWLVVRVIDVALFEFVFRLRRGAEAPTLLREITLLALFFVGMVFLSSATLSVHLTAVLATSAVVTAVVGLALQDNLGNLFAGLALHLEKSIQVGDAIRIGDTIGVVAKLSWRALSVRTLLGSTIVVPNGAAARERIEVFSRGPGPSGRTISVGLEYDVPPENALSVLRRCAAGIPGVAQEPPPAAYVRDFGEYAVQYEVRYWLDDYANYPAVESRIRETIWYRLRREGLRIPYPIGVRYQYNRDWPGEPLPDPPEPGLFDSVAIFAPLGPTERRLLLDRAARVAYARGENVVAEGDPGASLFVIERGSLAALVRDVSGREMIVGALGPGEAFGEMALLTGERRTATVRANSEAVLYRIDKEDVAPLLAANPALVGEISRVVEERRKETLEAHDRARVDAGRRSAAGAESVLSRIVRFFGLETPR